MSTLSDAHPDRQVLIVGADSVIGMELNAVLLEAGYSVVRTTRRKAGASSTDLYLDLTEKNIRLNPPRCTTAIFCAGVTSIERCRQSPAISKFINVTNTLHISRQLIKSGVHVVFLSSNMVFDGSRPRARITDPTCPNTEYGRQKAEVERGLIDIGERYTILRLSKIISPEMSLLQNWLNNLRSGFHIYPFLDKRISPLSLRYATKLVLRIIERRVLGIIHASATEDISYYQIARILAQRSSLDEDLIRPIVSSSFGSCDWSVPHTTLDTTSLKLLGMFAPEATDSFEEFLLKYMNNGNPAIG